MDGMGYIYGWSKFVFPQQSVRRFVFLFLISFSLCFPQSAMLLLVNLGLQGMYGIGFFMC
jgi:hypothetical protein